MVRTSLAVPQPFDADWMLGFLRARQAPALETIGERSITRAIRVDGRPATLRIEVGSRRIVAESTADIDRVALRALVRRMLDLDTDLDAFVRDVRRDRLLARLTRMRPGIRVPQLVDPFECVVRAVLGQQVSVRAATTLVNRLAVSAVSRRRSSAVGRRSPVADPYDGSAFPTAEQLAAAGPERLQRIGLTRARALALHGIALAIARRDIDLEALRAAPGNEAQAALDALPGIGPWTASYIRMRGLGDRDAFPAADLGVLKALGMDAAAAERRSAAWRPWRAYAVMYLWAAGR